MLTNDRKSGSDAVAMAASLTRHYRAVVVKLGAQGCAVAVPGEAPVLVAAQPVVARGTRPVPEMRSAVRSSATGWSAPTWWPRARAAVQAAAGAVVTLGARPR